VSEGRPARVSGREHLGASTGTASLKATKQSFPLPASNGLERWLLHQGISVAHGTGPAEAFGGFDQGGVRPLGIAKRNGLLRALASP